MAREITIAMQITVLRAALAAGGRVVLQQLLATCRSRTEATVTLLATLELVRRRQVRVRQRELFGPIVRGDDGMTAADDLGAFFEALLFIAERPLTQRRAGRAGRRSAAAGRGAR